MSISKFYYRFYKIPKAVYHNPKLSPCAKLLYTYLLSQESFLVNTGKLSYGSFFHCYERTLANQVGKSSDSVRKSYLPELIAEGYIEKKNVGGTKGDSQSTKCLFRIKWENLVSVKAEEGVQE